jgi:hypothetical protein
MDQGCSWCPDHPSPCSIHRAPPSAVRGGPSPWDAGHHYLALVLFWSLLHGFGISRVVHRTNCGAGRKRVHGRCWTSDRLFRHGIQDYRDCALCCQGPEELDHLIPSCSYSCEVWFKVFRRCGLQRLTPSLGQTFATWWINSRKQVPKARRKALDSLVILVSWRLWLQQNARVFSLSSLSASSLVGLIWEEALWWTRAGLIVWDSLVTL